MYVFIIKPNKFTNFLNLLWNKTLHISNSSLSIVRSFSLYTQQWYMSYRFADSLRAGSGRNCSSVLILLARCQQNLYDIYHCVPPWNCSQAVSKSVWHTPLLCVQWKTPDGGQRNCPKHVEFYSKSKFEKLVQLVGFIIRLFHDARSPEHQSTCTYVVTFRAVYISSPVSAVYELERCELQPARTQENRNIVIQKTANLYPSLIHNFVNFHFFAIKGEDQKEK